MAFLKALGKPFTALAGRVDHSVENKILFSVARHVATALGGYLVANGYLEMGMLEQFVGGVLVIIGAFSGAKQKVNAEA